MGYLLQHLLSSGSGKKLHPAYKLPGENVLQKQLLGLPQPRLRCTCRRFSFTMRAARPSLLPLHWAYRRSGQGWTVRGPDAHGTASTSAQRAGAACAKGALRAICSPRLAGEKRGEFLSGE